MNTIDQQNNSMMQSGGQPLSKGTTLRNYVLVGAAAALSLLFQYLPFKNLMTEGVYRWHVTQPEFVQGGVELLVLLAALVLAATVLKEKIGLVTVIVLSALYLRLHQVLEPVLLAIVYFEIVISLGSWSLRLLRISGEADQQQDHYLQAFLAGFIGWSTLAIVLSALGYGTFSHLRIMTGLAGIVSVTKGFNQPLIVALCRSVLDASKKERIVAVALVTLVLAVFAKANTAFDYDSLMYGLRPEHVLIGARSFFDDLGMLDTVYYYPKLLELFLAPLSDLGAYSFIYAGNILFLVLLAMTIQAFLRSLDFPCFESLLITLVICCLPVVANMAATAKTDTFTTFMIVAASYYLWMAARNRDLRFLLTGCAAAVLSFGGKPTSILFTPLILFGWCISTLIMKKRMPFRAVREQQARPLSIRAEGVLLALAVLVILGVYFRTYLLTGYPLYNISDTLNSIWEKVGFTIRYPLSTKVGVTGLGEPVLSDFRVSEILKFWYEIYFDPARLEHFLPVWTGNVNLYLFILAGMLLYNKRNWNAEFSFLLIMLAPLLVAGHIIAATFPLVARGGDGNYYLPQVVLSVVLFSQPFITRFRDRKTIIILCVIPFIFFQSAFMFVSHFSWAYGTSAFDGRLNKPFLTQQENNRILFEKNGMKEIAEYVAQQPRRARAIGIGDERILHRLPCRFEPANEWARINKKRYLMHRENELLEYLQWARIDYLILPNNPKNGYVLSTFDTLEKSPQVRKVAAERYYLLDISRVREAAPEVLAARMSENEARQEYQYLIMYHGLYERKRSQLIDGQYIFGPLRDPRSGARIGKASRMRPPVYVKLGKKVTFPVRIDGTSKGIVGVYVEIRPGELVPADWVKVRFTVARKGHTIVSSDISVTVAEGPKKVEFPLGYLQDRDVDIGVTVIGSSDHLREGTWPVWIETALQ